MPSAEVLGSRTALILRRAVARGSGALRGFAISWREWGREARRGLTGLVEVDSIKGVAPARAEVRTARPQPAPRRAPSPPPATMAPPEVVPAPSSQDHRSRPGVLEVSVLERLGFYDAADEIVVSLPPPAQPMVPGIAPSPGEQAGPANRLRRPLIPDIDLTGWKPHVIARSKLGSQRLSAFTVISLSVILLALIALAAGLIRSPGNRVASEGEALGQASAALASALTGLDPILADATTDVAEATSLLIAVDSSARNLFDAAASVGDGAEQQVMRQSAGSVAQRALQLESLIGEALSYRLVLNPLWRSPDLTGVTDPTQATAAISSWEAQLVDMDGILPGAAELSSHVEQVRSFISGMESWRTRYLDAVSAGDVAGAGAAVADLEGQLALLAQAGEETLTALFADAGTERGRLLADLAILAG